MLTVVRVKLSEQLLEAHSLSLEVCVEGLGGRRGKEGGGRKGEGKRHKVISSNPGPRSVLRWVSRAWEWVGRGGGRRRQEGAGGGRRGK